MFNTYNKSHFHDSFYEFSAQITAKKFKQQKSALVNFRQMPMKKFLEDQTQSKSFLKFEAISLF